MAEIKTRQNNANVGVGCLYFNNPEDANLKVFNVMIKKPLKVKHLFA